MPLFWLPWSIEVFEFSKQYLLIFLVSLAFLAWLAKMVVVQKRFIFRRTPLDLWILLFMFITILSASFSIDKISSWLGYYGRFSDSVIGLISVALLYFVITNNIKEKNEKKSVSSGEGLIPKEKSSKEESTKDKSNGVLSPKNIFIFFLSSSALVLIISLLSVFGIWTKIPNLPQVMSFKSFNPINSSLEGLSIFLVALIGFVVGMFLQQIKIIKSKKFSAIIYLFLIVFSVLLLMFINLSTAWLILGAIMLILLILALWTRMFKEQVNLLVLPIILIIIAGFYWFNVPNRIGILNELSFSRLELPQEITLDYKTSNSVVWKSLKEYPVLGSGPGTFINDFNKFKPVSFNESDFWNIRFDKASGQFLEIVATTGILGILSYIMIIGVFFLIVLVFFSRKKMESLTAGVSGTQDSKLGLPLVLAWLSLLFGQFVYYQNTTLLLYFWFFMALTVVIWQGMQNKLIKKIKFSFKKVPEVGLIFNVILLVLFFALIGTFYLGGRFYVAEAKLSRPVENSEELIVSFEGAVNLNRYRSNYRQNLSQVYLANAWNEVNKGEDVMDTQLVQALASGAIQQARTATVLNPNSVNTWENLGVIYRDSSGLVGGTLPFAIEAFEKAKDLEPNNPIYYREICRLNLTNEEKDWDKTVANCQKAVELKPNYLDAQIQLALVYEQKGEIEEAIKQMESILERLKGLSFQRGSELAGAATEIYFQLGRLYFNLNNTDKAIPMFEQSVIITPNYANARYALALSYQAKGRTQDALIQLDLVNQLVPDNENILALINQLNGVVPPAPVEQ